MKKVLSWLLTVMIAVTMTGGVLAEEAPAAELTDVVDFEDGLFGFVGMDMSKGNADESVLSVVDYNGSKALKVDVQKKVPYLSFNLDGMLGENIAKVASITADMGIDLGADGKFYAVSGRIYAYSGEEKTESYDEWSVYMKKANPKQIKAELSATTDVPETFIAGAGNYMIISKEVDNYTTKTGDKPLSLYLDNIRFLDAEGNAIPVDTTAEYVAPEAGVDLSNLCALTNVVEFPGFAVSGGAWSQNGLDIPAEVLDALVPGTALQIEFSSENGDMWIVLPDSAAGWMRVGNDGTDYVNNSKNIAQIPYELIAQLCGEDKTTWGARLQCEASGAWEVYAVKVGTRTPVSVLTNAVEFEGFSVSGGAWSQDGLAIPENVLEALVPGSVLEINYQSESGKLWIVMPDSAAGWMRVGDGNNGTADCDGSICRIPYEMIAEYCGEDKTTWGNADSFRLQCEADGAWEVYSVKVGQLAEMKMVNGLVDFAGFSVNGGAWSQNGLEVPQEIIDALVPGSVLVINFESETGNLWAVMPDAAAGWMRVGGCGNGQAVCKDGICQIPFELIAAYCGEDVSTWGNADSFRLQCESDSEWAVYSVAVGKGL